MPEWNPEELKCCGRWTPDGEFYLFLSHPSLYKGQLFPVQGQLWALDERRGRLRPPVPSPIQLTPGPMLWGPAITSPDGKRIFSRGLSLRGELVRYDRRSGRLKPFLNGISAEFVDFSKDGKYIAYTTFPDGILWRANLDGGGPLQLTKPPVYPRSTRWSPDGKKILFTDNSKDGVDTIYVVSSEGGAPERLIPEDSGPQGDATWSPDGRKVVYSTAPWFSFLTWSKSRVETRIFDLDSRKITVLPSYSGGAWSPRWSPDGRYIAAMSFNVSQLLIFDLEKQQWRVFHGKHPHTFGWLCWSKDSRHIYYGRAYYGASESESEVSRHPGNELWISRYSLERGTEERIANVTGLQVTGWYGLWRGIDPEEAPLMLRDVGTDEIYALTLERK